MAKLSDKELIERAVQVLQPFQPDETHWIGDVGCALMTDTGEVFTGISVESGSAPAYCAERSAIAEMLKHGHRRVDRIVAVWNNNPNKDLYILPPCGVCRQHMMELCQNPKDIKVILANDKVEKLADLLPYSDWPDKEE